MPNYLRPEARPADWRSLNDAQQKAFRQVLDMVTEAIQMLPDSKPRRDVRYESTHWLSADRMSRIVFLDGKRGTGKTTVMASLIAVSEAESDEAVRKSFPPTDLHYGINQMRTRAIWLEPVDMTSPSLSSNLLAAILARIEAAICWFERQESPGLGESSRGFERRGLLEPHPPHPDYRNAMLELQRLQANIALAWDGNLAARQGHLDPDSFAVEVIRTERARLSLHNNLEMVLDQLARSTSRSPLFILPIDDFDLNPPACLDLLRLLRMISVPRLFTVVLGDVEVAETILSLNLAGSVAQVADGVKNDAMLAVLPDEVGAMVGEVAAHTLRKFVPPTQRASLRPMRLLEALNFRPLGHDRDDDPRLHKLLAQCPVMFEVNAAGESIPETLPLSSGRVIDNLRDFLLVKKVSLIGPPTPQPEQPIDRKETQAELDREVTQASLNETAYYVPALLGTTLRRLTDLWLGLSQVCNREPEERRKIRADADAVLEVLQNHCYSLLAEEPAVSPESRRNLLRDFRGRPGAILDGIWDFPALAEGLKLKIYPAPAAREHVIDASTHAYDPTNWRLQFHVKPVRDFWLTRSDRELSGDLTLVLVLLHDLLAVGPEHFSGPWLPDVAPQHLFATEWRSRTNLEQKVELRCPAPPPWVSFWEVAPFRHLWGDAIDRIRHSQLPYEDAIRTLAFAWIAEGTAVVERRDPVRQVSEVTDHGDWERLYERLNRLVPDRMTNTPWAIRTRNWLTNVAIFLMPESGIPDGPALQSVTAASRLLGFWNQQGHLISERRALRLARLVKNNMQDLAERLRLHPFPDGVSDSLRPTQARVSDLAQGLDSVDDEESEA